MASEEEKAKDLMSQLPWRVKALVYLRGIDAFVAPWLVYPLGMALVGLFTIPNQFAADAFLSPLGIVAWLDVAVWGVLATIGRELVGSKLPEAGRWRRATALLGCAGFVWAMHAMPGWFLESRGPLIQASQVREAYALDLRSTRLAEKGSPFDPRTGKVAALLDKDQGSMLGRGESEWGEGHDSSLASALEQAKMRNGDMAGSVIFLMAVGFAIMEVAMGWAMGWLIWVPGRMRRAAADWAARGGLRCSLAGVGRAAIDLARRAGAKGAWAGRAGGLGAPKAWAMLGSSAGWAWRSVKSGGALARAAGGFPRSALRAGGALGVKIKSVLEEAALEDPRVRARLERAEIERAAAKPPRMGDGPGRL